MKIVIFDHRICFYGVVGPEYGELEMVWLTILGEGDTVSAMHSKMSCELSSEHREGIRRPVHKYIYKPDCESLSV